MGGGGLVCVSVSAQRRSDSLTSCRPPPTLACTCLQFLWELDEITSKKEADV